MLRTKLTQIFQRFSELPASSKPPRTLGDRIQHDEKEDSRNNGDTEFPSPFICSDIPARNYVVRQVRGKYHKNDVDLEPPDQPTSPLCRRNFRDIYRPEARRAPDSQS